MLFANRLLGAQLSSAWKQTSYPALGETTLPAFPSLLSGRREIYKPKRRLYGVRCDSLSSSIN